MAYNAEQAIIWTIDVVVYWRIYVLPGLGASWALYFK